MNRCQYMRWQTDRMSSAGVTPVDVFSTVFIMCWTSGSRSNLSLTRLSKRNARRCRNTIRLLLISALYDTILLACGRQFHTGVWVRWPIHCGRPVLDRYEWPLGIQIDRHDWVSWKLFLQLSNLEKASMITKTYSSLPWAICIFRQRSNMIQMKNLKWIIWSTRESMSFDLESHTTHHLTCWTLSNEFRYHAISDTHLSRSLMSITTSSFADV